MKSFLPVFLVAILAFTAPMAADAKPKKGKGKPEPQQPAAADPSNPAAALAPYIENLDGLLALNRPADKAKHQLFEEASGRMVTLRQEFIGEAGKVADDQKGKFKAAEATCDVIRAALDDREKTLADLKSSGAVANSAKLEQASKKDNLTQGIKGGSTAKAVGSIVERDRERQSIAQADARAKGGDKAMTAMATNNWTKRSVEWREKVAASYAQIK